MKGKEMSRTNYLTITRPDDLHHHVRDNGFIGTVLPHIVGVFGRAIIMPNTKPPITTVEQALAYRERIMKHVPPDTGFEPLMTLYLTDNTSPDEIDRAVASGVVKGVKYYPAGVTTNSDEGVSDITKVRAVLKRMEKLGMPLLVHGESANPGVDVFDREKVCIEETLYPLTLDIAPRLKIVFEHITTKAAVDFVKRSEGNVAATITAHHLLSNRNDMLGNGIRPHLYCKPIPKRVEDQRALIGAAISGNPKFFLGTDSAPHAQGDKECACGCAGVFTAHAALELYAEAFDLMNALDKLEGFASHFGADFYGLPRNTGTITLIRESSRVPNHYPFGNEGKVVVPYRAGELIHWSVEE